MRTLIVTAMACAGLALIPTPQVRADIYDEFFAALNWLTGKYGLVVYVNQGPLPDGVYARTVGDTITLNSNMTADPAVFYSNAADDVAAGYHRTANCSAPAAVAAHEYGHAIDFATDGRTQTELLAALRSGFGGVVSEYALESPAEAIAESFAAVECDVPTPAEQAIYTMLVN